MLKRILVIIFIISLILAGLLIIGREYVPIPIKSISCSLLNEEKCKASSSCVPTYSEMLSDPPDDIYEKCIVRTTEYKDCTYLMRERRWNELTYKCYPPKKISVRDPSQCRKITNITEFKKQGMDSYECYSAYVRDVKSLKECKVLTEDGTSGVNNWEETCYWTLAVNTKNKDFCLNIEEGGSRSFCYKEVAIATKDRNICDTIADSYYRDECYS